MPGIAALGIVVLLIAVFAVVTSSRRDGSGPTIAVGRNPIAIAITPDGTTAYVVNMNSNTVTPVRLATGGIGTAIPVNGLAVSDGARDIAIAPDGATAYVGDEATGTLIPISLASGMAGTPIAIAGGAGPIAITPDGATAYVVTGD
ncbi:MAG TPA: hypothetical protein VK823_24310, partial [Streptosporangiaceae bacterium]|nr:hypothetical protein [Streptosporangiaceae bacterium]